MKSMRVLGGVVLCVVLLAVGGLRAEEKEQAKPKAESSPSKAVKKLPKPVIYDDFSDGRLEKRTGKDPWGRKLPEWKFKGERKPDTSKGYLSAKGGKKWKTVSISIPSEVAYGTWQWKYRHSKGRTPYGNKDCSYFFTYIICPDDALRPNYFRGLISDGHTWFGIHKKERGWRQILHNLPGGWGTGLFVDKRWHVCRITRDRKKGFTIYHDNRIITSGWGAGNPRDNGKNGLFTEVKDDTYKTCKKFAMTMKPAVGGVSIDVDDIKIYDVVLPAPIDMTLRELYATGEGKNPAKLPRLVNYASAKMGAKASGSASEKAAMLSSNMIDGVTTDYSGGNGFGYSLWPKYLTVQLNKQQPIGDIYLSLWDFTAPLMSRKSPGPRKYDFEVDVSVDGKTWTNVAKREKAIQLQKISVGGRKVRYIRMRGKHYREYQHAKYPTPPKVQRVVDEFYVVEIEAYGPAAK